MKAGSRPNQIDWAKARTAYVNSLKTSGDIAQEFGATLAAVEKRAFREHWGDERRALSERVTKASQKRLTADRVKALADFNEDNLQIAHALTAQVRAHLNASATAKIALKHDKLRALAGTAEVAQRLGRLALGAANDTAPPMDPAEGARKIREALAEMDKADGIPATLVNP